MHRVLQIQEILLNIFNFRRIPRTLYALARTCRAFKEPALDILWEVLDDASPIARCLPGAHDCEDFAGDESYVFNRPLTRVEWSILRSYTRRIRSILDPSALDWESVVVFLNPAVTDPLFPNLRRLDWDSLPPTAHMLYMPFPSMVSLRLEFTEAENPSVLWHSFESFSRFSPNIEELRIHIRQPEITSSQFFSSCIRRWQNIQTLLCGNIAFDMDTLIHLSRMPALTSLSFSLCDTLLDQITLSVSPLVFSNLDNLALRSKFLDPVLQLLSRTRFPTLTDFTTFIEKCPSKLDMSSFLVNIQTSGIGRTVQKLRLSQTFPWDEHHDPIDTRPVLDLEYLRPCMAFNNLCHLNVDIEWEVRLSNGDLLALTSAWPNLNRFVINELWGWNSSGGITPNELVQFLQAHRSLRRISVAIDTRGYTNSPLLPPGLTLPPSFSLNLVDSMIEEEAVPAMASFLAGLAPGPKFSFDVWDGALLELDLTGMGSEYKDRWYDVYEQTHENIRARANGPSTLGTGVES